MTPLVCIATPVYRAAGTVEETIASVRGQRFEDWEWYILDDGSDDETADVVEKAIERDARIKLIRCPRVGHIGVLRNRALAQTQAPYFSFIDGDDIWDVRFLEEQVCLLKTLDVGFVHCAVTNIVEGVEVEAPAHYHGPERAEPEHMLGLLMERNPINSPSVVMRSDVLRSVGGFSEHPLHFSVLDFDLWLKVVPHRAIGYNPEPMVKYRISPTSLSGNPQNRILNYQGCVLALEDFVQRQPKLPGALMQKRHVAIARNRFWIALEMLEASTYPAREIDEHLCAAARLGMQDVRLTTYLALRRLNVSLACNALRAAGPNRWLGQTIRKVYASVS